MPMTNMQMQPHIREDTMSCPRADAKEGFFAGLVDTVVRSFGGFYPELCAARDTIYAVIRDEEASFSRTLLKGIEKFKKAAAVAKEGEHLSGGARDSSCCLQPLSHSSLI